MRRQCPTRHEEAAALLVSGLVFDLGDDAPGPGPGSGFGDVVEIAVGADRLASFDHGYGGLAVGPLCFLEQDIVARQAEAVRELGGLLLEQIAGLDAKIAGLEREVHVKARQDEEARRLMSVSGTGPITAMAILAFAPPMESFRRGRDFSAWLGLVPRQHTTGGKPKLGRTHDST